MKLNLDFMKSDLAKQTAIAALLLGGFTALIVSADSQGTLATEPKPKWESSASAGLTLARGNSDTLLFTADITGSREWQKNTLSLGADAAYGENKDTKTTESLHGFAQYDRLLTTRAYGYGRLDARHDSIADVDYRFSLGPGAGYHLLRSDRMQLRLEGGPGVVVEKQGGESDNYLTLRVAEVFKFKLTDRARLWQSLEIQPEVSRFKNFLARAELGVEADLTKKLSLRASLQDNYDHEPAPGRKKNDLKLVTAIGYKF